MHLQCMIQSMDDDSFKQHDESVKGKQGNEQATGLAHPEFVDEF